MYNIADQKEKIKNSPRIVVSSQITERKKENSHLINIYRNRSLLSMFSQDGKPSCSPETMPDSEAGICS